MNEVEFTDAEVSEAKRRWREAAGIEELCEFTARFIEGHFPYHPSYGAPSVASETGPLVDHLAALNRLGFLTVGSQPGFHGEGYDGQVWEQRAFVSGFAPPDTAERMTSVTLTSDVVAYAVAPEDHEPTWYSIPGTRNEDGPTLWIGRASTPDTFFLPGSVDDERLSIQLSLLHYVEAFDPRWGRTGYLWKHFEKV